MNSSCRLVSPVSSGWKAVTSTSPSRAATRDPVAGEDLDAGAGALDPRRADEDGAQRRPIRAGDLEIGLEAAHLAAERVAPRDDVDEAERRRVALDGARAPRVMRPAQVPNTAPPAVANAWMGSTRS